MKNMKKQSAQGKNSDFPLYALIGGGAGLAVTFAAAAISPLILLSAKDPNAGYTVAAAGSAALGGLVGGIFSAYASKGREIFSGLICFAVMMLPLLIISFSGRSGFDLSAFAVVTAAVAISVSAGAFAVLKIFSGNKRNMKKALKRRKM